MTTNLLPRPKEAPDPPRRRRGRRLLLGLLLGAVTLLVLGLAGFVTAYALVPVPEVKPEALAQTTVVYYADGKTEIGSFGTNRTNVDLAAVPRHVRDAVLAAEDREFFANRGISPRGIARAFVNNVRGEATQGGSTITQQYVKNAHLTQERTYSRKTQEIFIALKVDRQLPKEQILENYFNTIYWGRGAYGVEAAAQAYFDKPVGELSVSEGAYLAGIIQSPGRYDPRENREGALRRWNYVLDGMVAQGWLRPADRARLEFPKVAKAARQQRLDGPKGYLLDTVRDELEALGFSEQEVDTAGLRVTTTFEERAQKGAEKAMREEFPTTRTDGVHAGLAAIRPGDGAVTAMYGGPDFVEQGFNDATQAKKQGGSTFKAFTLAAALEEGVSLDSTWQGDSPILLPRDEKVDNEASEAGGPGTDYGRVDLWTATTKSINTAFVDLATSPQLGGMEEGPERVVEAVRAAGLGADKALGLEAVPTVTLGTASVSPVDLANSYATFAAGGQRSSWYTIASVHAGTGADDLTLYKVEKDVDRVFEEEVATSVTAALRGVVREEGTGRRAQALGRPAAGKTGTHEAETAWFVGYTPQLAAAVGFYREDENGRARPLSGVGGEERFFGGNYPTRIWTAFMTAALEGEPVVDFPGPDLAAPGAGGPPATPLTPSATSTGTQPEPGESSASSPDPSATEPSPSVSVPSPTRSASPSPSPTRFSPSPTRTRSPSASPTRTRPTPGSTTPGSTTPRATPSRSGTPTASR